MTEDKFDSRAIHFHAKVLEKQRTERTAAMDKLVTRPDYRPEMAYFVELFRGDLSLSAVAQRVGQPVAAILCVQTPLELLHAFGFHPFKIFGGSYGAGQVVAHLPALMCPMLRSAIGTLTLETPPHVPWIIPTSCDWVVKFPEMARLNDSAGDMPVHWMELPRLKDSPRARDRWYAEVLALSDFLGQSRGGCKLSRKTLSRSIEVFKRARQSFSRLIALRHAGMVAAPWFSLIANSFFLDRVENWTAALEKALPGFNQTVPDNGRIFLAGSPLFFPNFKLLHLLEDAGLYVADDDLCSSERIFPVNVAVNDTSVEGLLGALAESYHQGCLCSVFGDSEHRINNIRAAIPDGGFKGLVFHVLKGCHPYDLDSFIMESALKETGLRFLRLESDYATEDSQNILTRLEAYRRTLGD